MFKVVDCERLTEDRFRLVVETEDASLFALLSVFESLTEFTGMFRYRSKCALRIKDREASKDILYQAAQEERAEMLALYEAMPGSQKERWHVVLAELKKRGKDWMLLDDVIVLLKIARSERKNQSLIEHKKSA